MAVLERFNCILLGLTASMSSVRSGDKERAWSERAGVKKLDKFRFKHHGKRFHQPRSQGSLLPIAGNEVDETSFHGA